MDQNQFKNRKIHGGLNDYKQLRVDLPQPRSKDEHNFSIAFIEPTTSSLYVVRFSNELE